MENKKKTELVSGEKHVCSEHVEPLIKNIYTMKAIQSSNQPDTLTWDSVGDQVTYNSDGSITMQEWKRQCIFLCSSDEFGDKPGYFLTDYDGYYDLPSYGNKLFKAVMCKLAYDVALPPYTSAEIDVQAVMAFSKSADSCSSSTWLGVIAMKSDHCKTIGKYNKEHNEWSGVPSSEVYSSYECNYFGVDGNCLSVTNYNQTVDNTSDKIQHHLLDPIYMMAMVERAKSYNTYLGFGDSHPYYDYIIVKPYFTSIISYNNDEKKSYGYNRRRTGGIFLKKPKRMGYTMKGWLDSATERLYPAGGYYAEKRGINLTEQWIEDVVRYRVVHHYAQNDGTYLERTETFNYMADGTVCSQPAEDYRYKTPEPITTSVAADGSTVIDYYYEIKECPVQYLANGGCFSSGKDVLEIKVPFGMPIDLLEKPERTGYEFVDWNPHKEYADSSYIIVTKAVWKAIEYTVQYDKNDANATGEMEAQGFVYDQPQQLRKNTYECRHAIKYEVVTPKGEKISFEQTVKCGFVGWATQKNGEKIYNDEEPVCNLTTEDGGQVQLEALWEPASIRLPQFDYEGYYLDAWYENAECEGTPIEPGSEYKPKEGVTLYGKLICTKVENAEWDIRSAEYVYERPIWATWKEVEGAIAYRVGLENEDKKVNYPLYAEDFSGEGVTYINAGAVEVIGTELDFTKAFKRFTVGGSYQFSVEPIFKNIPEGSIGRTVSDTVTTLARPENLRWDETRTVAMWDGVEGADYYLMWLYSEGRPCNNALGGSVSPFCGLEQYRDIENCVIVRAVEVDLSSIVGIVPTVQFEVVGYREEKEYYTPLYEHIRSEANEL